MNMDFKRKLPIPMDIKEKFPLSAKMEEVFEKRAADIRAIFEGRDDRFILIIGPCSVMFFMLPIVFIFSASS